MKKTYFKYIIKSIKQDSTRLLAILSIVALGVGFLIGLLSSAPDLYKSADKLYQISNASQINLKSNYGFSIETCYTIQNEILDINNIDFIKEYEGNFYNNSTTFYTKIQERSFESNSPNKLTLIKGTMPSKANECVLLQGNANLIDFRIGDKINLKINEEQYSYTITGFVKDSYYISKQAISSLINSKNIQCVAYLDLSCNNIFPISEYFTDIQMTFKSLQNIDSFKDKYVQLIDNKIIEIENVISSTNLLEKNLKGILSQSVKTNIINNLIQTGLSIEQAEAYLKTEQGKSLFDSILTNAYIESINTNPPLIHILDRSYNPSMVLFKNDAEKMAVLSYVFPIFFFTIALLVSCSSMSRIISKDRILIGGLKAHGYTNKQISIKYYLYGFLSTIIGSLLGILGGIFLIPYIIFNIYSSMYYLPTIIFGFEIIYILPIILLMILSILVMIGFVLRRYLKESAATLMVGLKPKKGKKILLERLPFIWRKIKFKYKSMLRNIFRFKKNLIMMIVGVGGCSALLLTGFGLNDSLSVLSKRQYKEIFQYNFIVNCSNPSTTKELLPFENSEIIHYYENGIINNNSEYKVHLVSSTPNLSNYYEFKNIHNKKVEYNKDSIFITSQLADELKLKIGSKFIYKINNQTADLTVTNIIVNYVNNYIYLGEDVLASKYNLLDNAIISYHKLEENKVNSFIDTLYQINDVNNVIYTYSSLDTYSSLMDNLKMVVVLIILISFMLAIIVIYNLVDININERIKEIATLRVIGYQKRDVVLYIFREIFIMTLIGLSFGLVLGLGLHAFIINSIANPGLSFGKNISLISFLLTTILTIFFALFVTFILSFKIVKIDMVESLKSVE